MCEKWSCVWKTYTTCGNGCGVNPAPQPGRPASLPQGDLLSLSAFEAQNARRIPTWWPTQLSFQHELFCPLDKNRNIQDLDIWSQLFMKIRVWGGRWLSTVFTGAHGSTNLPAKVALELWALRPHGHIPVQPFEKPVLSVLCLLKQF